MKCQWTDGRHIHVSTCPLPEKNGQLVILQDLTATRKLQESISRQQRLDSMGHMLAAVAHQLRTPLTTAMLQTGNLEWMLQDKLPSAGQKSLKVLEQQLQAIEQKISNLLLFARGSQNLHDQMTTAEFLEELQHYCGNDIWNKLSLDWHIEDISDREVLLCNRSSLLSAFGNLIHNAIEAGATQASLSYISTPQQLIISLTDNGPGVDDLTASQLMEPFFTTKTTGTGLGLPIVRIVTEVHGGIFALNPTTGQGLQVVITLPLQPPYNVSASAGNGGLNQ